MLISEEKIKEYLQNIPPLPESAAKTLQYLKEGDLKKAAIEADNDLVLKKQIESVVNSAYFSLPNKVENTVQLFTMIGLEMASSLVYTHIVSLLKPKKWSIFDIDFKKLQIEFLALYEKYMILEFDKKTYKRFHEIGAIIPVAVCVCDMLLGEKKNELKLITDSSPLEIGTILKRMTGVTLFGIAAEIAKTWGIKEEKCNIIQNSECLECENPISALTHFLFFYLVSKSAFMDLNSLIEFKPECMELIPKTTQRIINANQ